MWEVVGGGGRSWEVVGGGSGMGTRLLSPASPQLRDGDIMSQVVNAKVSSGAAGVRTFTADPRGVGWKRRG